MKKTKIIIPSLGLLLLSTAASVSGTVAWFSANSSVKVSGMQVTTKVSGNLLIAEDNASDDYYSTANLTQGRVGVLEPVSSINGSSFFYTVDKIKGTGESTNVADPANHSAFYAYNEATAQAHTAAGKTAYDAAFNTAYGVTAAVTTSNVLYGYIDYAFYVKATSSADGQKVVISKLNLLYNGAALDTETATTPEQDLAWRVALFSQPVAKETNSATDGTLVSVYKHTSAAYFNNEAVSAADTTLNAAAEIGTIANKGDTQRYKVVVRLWLEGNDTTCNNDTYAELTEAYTLGLKCELGGTAITSLGSDLTAY